MTRAHIRLHTEVEIQRFINALAASGCDDAFSIEDDKGHHRSNARSFLGVLYASSEFCDHMYLINDTNDGVFPYCIDEFRVLG